MKKKLIFSKQYKKDESIRNKIDYFFNYFIKTWRIYFTNGILNYKYLNFKKRSNSFIENYNRQLHNIINNHIKSKIYTSISWSLFISLLINEENWNKNLIIINLNKNTKKTDILFVKTKLVVNDKIINTEVNTSKNYINNKKII